MPELADYIKQGKLSVKVKANASKTRITAYEPVLCVDVAAPPEQHKANIELLKFFQRELKKPVKLLVGATSKRKVFKIG